MHSQRKRLRVKFAFSDSLQLSYNSGFRFMVALHERA